MYKAYVEVLKSSRGVVLNLEICGISDVTALERLKGPVGLPPASPRQLLLKLPALPVHPTTLSLTPYPYYVTSDVCLLQFSTILVVARLAR